MKVNVNIKLNEANIKALVQAYDKAAELTTEALLSDIEASAVTPKQSGELERSGFPDKSQSANGKFAIVFNTPYARRLYWHPEYRFRTDKNINAQGKWMQSYVDGDKKDFAKDTLVTFLKQFSKGVIK